jgi:hypothetical protein
MRSKTWFVGPCAVRVPQQRVNFGNESIDDLLASARAHAGSKVGLTPSGASRFCGNIKEEKGPAVLRERLALFPSCLYL